MDKLIIKIVGSDKEVACAEWVLPPDYDHIQDAQELLDILGDIVDAHIAKWQLEDLQSDEEAEKL